MLVVEHTKKCDCKSTTASVKTTTPVVTAEGVGAHLRDACEGLKKIFCANRVAVFVRT